MKIVIAPDSFKECMSAQKASITMKEAVRKVLPNSDVSMLPVADGGEGTLEVLTYATNGKIYETTVTGPLGEEVTARYSILGDKKTAVVEMAEASGLHLVPLEKRNPLLTTTFGTGELMKAALQHNIEHLIVTIGGSSTNDCGVGMLQAIGAKITDDEGVDITFGGGSLDQVAHIDLSQIDSKMNQVTLSVACDVNNPLTGENGASYVFGPQKGATPEMVELLDRNISHFSLVVKKATGIDIGYKRGSGAAGGLGAALLMCGGKLKRGIDLVLDALQFDDQIVGASYIFTGEGRIDNQTPDGKVIAGIVQRASKMNIPVIAFGGSVARGYEPLYEQGLLSVHSITQGPCSLEQALQKGRDNLSHTVQNVMRVIAGNP
ncbi:glycerate kinase [Salirhabdus salicampi]|uniref:glycerate kinase n=1 Tax=Salirhabdus salicampi TaxID=476102 RepID=UPI0020C34B9B|nr:glycerate kinase [Salirhabdus salicampi]MCP8617875.1 glycerate kinase [Salirhabdus salicampi]